MKQIPIRIATWAAIAALIPVLSGTGQAAITTVTDSTSVEMDTSGSDAKFYRLRLTYTPAP